MAYINKTFKFAFSNSQLLLLDCKSTSGKRFYTLIDTGSEVTIIDKKLEDDLFFIDDSKNDIVFHSLHGEETSRMDIGAMKVFINDTDDKEQAVRFEGVMSDLSNVSKFVKDTYNINKDILIVYGSDSLNREGAVIDCELGQITL